MLVTERLYRKQQTIRVPPIPFTVGLTDRTTGKIWYLKVDPANLDLVGNPRLVLTDTIALGDQKQAYIFDAWSGPGLGQSIRLFVRNGRLGYETVTGYTVSSQPVIARAVNNDLIWYLLALPAGFPVANNTLAYTLEPSS